ncbi:MAG: hypothetical protein ACKVP7_10830 [Hyphomicrobiaceae bacterium]
MRDLAQETPHPQAVAAAKAVMTAHLTALNARDNVALTATLHFPHHRLSMGRLQTWTTPDSYFADFLQRAEPDWDRSRWDFLNVVTARADKVHLDVGFTRLRTDGSSIGHYRSLWVIARLNGRWAAQLRSSFAD